MNAYTIESFVTRVLPLPEKMIQNSFTTLCDDLTYKSSQDLSALMTASMPSYNTMYSPYEKSHSNGTESEKFYGLNQVAQELNYFNLMNNDDGYFNSIGDHNMNGMPRSNNYLGKLTWFTFSSAFLHSPIVSYDDVMHNMASDNKCSNLPPRDRSKLSLFAEQNLAKFRQILSEIPDDQLVLSYSKPKMASKTPYRSKRRSKFTGVFKNGHRWQTLVSIMKKKTYVGTFKTEIEAARVYDFYSFIASAEFSGM